MPSSPRPVVRVSVPAKVNLHLSVGPRRPDGFHDLQTVFHAVDLYDEIVASPADSLSLTVTGASAGVPTDDTNIVCRAAALLAHEAGVDPAVRLRVHKRIPVAGGMAGGSADAAGTLLACRALWGVDVSDLRLADLAAELGSDVPFQLVGGTALGTGRGELLTPLACPPMHWVMIPASFGISAADAYRELDRQRDDGAAPPPAGPPTELLALLAGTTDGTVAAALRNDLQPAALALRPELAKTLLDGAHAESLAGLVSGSGPTCAFLFHTRVEADAAAARLRDSHPGTVAASGPVAPRVCA